MNCKSFFFFFSLLSLYIIFAVSYTHLDVYKRQIEGSVIHDPQAVAARVVRMATEGTVETVDGGVIELTARSICVHGDTQGAVEIARTVRGALADAGVELAPFA